MKNKINDKSWKREIAGALLAAWLIITFRLFFSLEAEDIKYYDAIYNNLTFIIIPSALAMFGIHGKFGSKPEPKYDPEDDISTPPDDYNN